MTALLDVRGEGRRRRARRFVRGVDAEADPQGRVGDERSVRPAGDVQPHGVVLARLQRDDRGVGRGRVVLHHGVAALTAGDLAVPDGEVDVGVLGAPCAEVAQVECRRVLARVDRHIRFAGVADRGSQHRLSTHGLPERHPVLGDPGRVVGGEGVDGKARVPRVGPHRHPRADAGRDLDPVAEVRHVVGQGRLDIDLHPGPLVVAGRRPGHQARLGGSLQLHDRPAVLTVDRGGEAIAVAQRGELVRCGRADDVVRRLGWGAVTVGEQRDHADDRQRGGGHAGHDPAAPSTGRPHPKVHVGVPLVRALIDHGLGVPLEGVAQIVDAVHDSPPVPAPAWCSASPGSIRSFARALLAWLLTVPTEQPSASAVWTSVRSSK